MSGPSSNVLAVMQQLRDCQERLLRSEARCEVLLDENRRLRDAVDAQQRATARPGDVLAAHWQAERDANDRVLSELQRQLTEALRRNTQLESDAHARHSALRKQYESHIDALELELMRARAAGGAAASPPPPPLHYGAAASPRVGLAAPGPGERRQML